MENSGAQILLVEDNPHEARLTIACLKENNLDKQLVHVDDGAQALDFMFAQGEFSKRKITDTPKMILLDLNLPKIGGLEVLKQIKANEHTRSVPVIILSSSNQDSDLATSYSLGVNSYIVKPVDFETFAKAVSDLGAYWATLNQLPHAV